MRVRRKQFHTVDHPLFPVIEEPVPTGFEARSNRVSGRGRMLGRMLARRAIAASDVAVFRTPPEVKPPTFR
jgi:hypothetical protein